MAETTPSEAEMKKPAVKEIPFIFDQGTFEHETGDTYEGFFEAKKKDRTVKMNGPGVYTTAEGDTYTGAWEGDKLGVKDEPVRVAFTDGSSYEGPMKEWNYTGSAKYAYPDGSLLRCNFSENSPIGALILSDPNEHVWLGKAEQGFGWLEPVNHYYAVLDKTVKHQHKSRRRTLPKPIQVPVKKFVSEDLTSLSTLPTAFSGAG